MRQRRHVTQPGDRWELKSSRVLAMLALLVIACLSLGAQQASARSGRLPRGVRSAHVLAGGRLSDPQATCDVPQPQDQYITFPSFAQSDQEICGIWSLEDDAAAAYDTLHGYPSGDQRAVDTGLPQEAGYAETFLEALAYQQSTGATDLTPDQQGGLAWLEAVEQQFNVTAAQDALDEYDKWVREQCDYLPPSTSVFSYRPKDQDVCHKDTSLDTLTSALTPPSEADFISYGTYEADQAFDINGATGSSSDQLLIDQGITEGAGAVASVIAGGAPQALSQLESLRGSFRDLFDAIHPEYESVTYTRVGKNVINWRAANLQKANAIDEVKRLGEEGLTDEEIDPDLLESAQAAEAEMDADTGLSEAYTDAVEAGADEMSAEFAVATIALTIAVTEGEAAVTAADIPNQLQTNLSQAEHPSNMESYAWSQLTGSSYQAVNTLTGVEGQMQFPQTTIGSQPSLSCPSCLVYDSPPTTATTAPAQLRMTALNPDGTPAGWSSTATTAANIDTWPMGAANGGSGVPEVNVAIDNGEVWTSDMTGTAPTDQSEAGLSGYLPSGELHYFNAAGKPMIAYIDGDQFETLTNPGSDDAGGADAGDACATLGECTASNSIVVMAYGGTPQLQDILQPGTFLGSACSFFIGDAHSCDSDNLQPDGDLVPAGGSTSATSTGTIQQQGTSQLYRLTIDPDNGTPAGTWVANKYNTTANDLAGGAPNGGLIAGQTVTFTDPDISPQGYSTTYTWQIQALCAYDQGHSPKTIQGVPVCSSSPDYDSTSGLAADEQDLTSCSDSVAGTTCNPAAVFGWSEDPAFHGGAVTTLTGQSVNWTWPAPGTYHVRLITTDQNGVSVTSDQNLVVSASSAPSSTFSWSAASGKQPAWVAPSVIGPVTDGDAVTLTGCVSSPDTVAGSAYSTPSVKVDWGDGSTPDSGTAGASTDANLMFTFDPGGGCSTPWEYQATHTYTESTSGLPFIQVPIEVTVGDVTDPATPADLLPAGVSTSSTTKVYANVYASSAPPSFVSGAFTSYSFQTGVPQTVTGYVTSASTATLYATPTTVSKNGVTCSGLPAGMGFQAVADNSFTISGTAGVNAGGCYAIDVDAGNANGTATELVVVNVAQAPAFTSGTSVGWTTGSTGSFTVDTSGFPTPALQVTGVTCTPGCGSSLPADISFKDNGDGTATLSSAGADIAAGDTGVYDITLSASSSSGTVTQTLKLTIAGPPIFTSPNTAGFPVQQDKTFNINVTGLSGQPAGSITCTIVYDGSPAPCLSDSGYSRIDPSPNGVYGLYFIDGGNGTATIGGAAYAAGSYALTLTATNAAGDSVQQTLSIYVSNTGGAQLTMPTPLTGPDNGNLVSYTAPSGQAPAFGTARFIVGQSGSVTLCSDEPSDTLTSQSQLPAGLTLTNGVTGTACPSGDEATTISGTPSADVNPNSTGYIADRIVSSANGLADLTIYLINAGNNGNYSSGTPSITTPSTAVFTEGTSGSFTTSIGTVYYGDYQILYGCLSESGAMPDGLSFADHDDNTGILSGTPTQTGTFTVTITGTDCDTDSTTQQLTIVVRKAPSITSAHSAGFQVGAGGTFTVTTNADAYPTPTLSAGVLPAGVTFTDNGDGTGTLTVAPDAPKTSTAVPIAITASSVAGTATQQFDLAVGVGPQISAPATSPTPVVMATGRAASYTVATSGVPTPALSCSITGKACSTANLPAGVTFTDNGDGTATVSGTPTTLGTTDLTITASNGVGTPASTTLDVAVDAAPSFAGTTTSGSCASAAPGTTSDTFVADSASSWTLCGSGTPAPAITLKSVTCGSASANLPSGVTFSDSGDGSATLSGTAAIGTGAACPGGYSLDLNFTNAAGSVDKQLMLKVQEVIVGTTPATTAPIVAGAPNQVVLGAAGSPAPAFAPAPSTPLPSWLKLESLGNGTAALTGKPPAGAAGTSIAFSVDVTNSDANTLVESITVPVSKIVLSKAAPPAARLGHAYSYRFNASAGATFAVAPGSKLPLGLRLSRAGLLSGTPKELGRFAIALKLTGAGQTATTGMLTLTVNAGKHPLEIGQFRTVGPKGEGDWFVQIVNTTPVTIPLTGWDLGLQQVGSKTPALIPLGTGKLAPGRTVVVSGTGFSRRSKLAAHHFGATAVPVLSGFEIMAPSGAAVDAAGLRGAPRSLLAGKGLRYPRHLQRHKQYAFVRDGFAAGRPVDTGNNAKNFKFGNLVLHPHRTLTHTVTKKKHKKKKKA